MPTRRCRIHAAVVAALMAALTLLGNPSLPTLAATSLADLGRPTDALSSNPAFPLSGFHRTSVSLRKDGKPELLFLGTQVDPQSAKERWPVVKALAQFGTFTNLKPDTAWVQRAGEQGIPTFDWSRAGYTSRYVAFVHKDLIDRTSWSRRVPRRLHGLTPQERALYTRYVRPATTLSQQIDPDHLAASLCWEPCNTTWALPLILAGRYVQTLSQIVADGDFERSVLLHPGNPQSPIIGVPLPFSTIHDALVRGQDPAGTRLVEDVNAEANIITALICRADHLQPTSVCGRPAVKTILGDVR